MLNEKVIIQRLKPTNVRIKTLHKISTEDAFSEAYKYGGGTYQFHFITKGRSTTSILSVPGESLSILPECNTRNKTSMEKTGLAIILDLMDKTISQTNQSILKNIKVLEEVICKNTDKNCDLFIKLNEDNAIAARTAQKQSVKINTMEESIHRLQDLLVGVCHRNKILNDTLYSQCPKKVLTSGIFVWSKTTGKGPWLTIAPTIMEIGVTLANQQNLNDIIRTNGWIVRDCVGDHVFPSVELTDNVEEVKHLYPNTTSIHIKPLLILLVITFMALLITTFFSISIWSII